MLLGVYLLNHHVIIYNFEQSAGNQPILFLVYNVLVGTSETKRDPRNLLREDIVRVIKSSLIPLKISISNFIKPRFYSNLTNHSDLDDQIRNLKPVKVYNLQKDRLKILKNEKDKPGVYYFINQINGHTYVGSSINLASRMRNYLNNTFLKSKQNLNMPIVKALLKYDQSNFTLLILEYVEAEFLTIRETFYITHVMPYYNVLKQGYSSLGYKHTEETKKLLFELAKNRRHSDKTKALIARALTGENNPFYKKSHSIESKIRIMESKSTYPVYIYNSYKELLVIFPSASSLAKLVKSNQPTLVETIKQKTLFRGE
jgi:group I intron endonuclease